MTTTESTGRRVLVVDDDQGARLLTRLALAQWGLDVLEAQDGVEAVDLCRRLRPDAVLLDARMPRMDGFHACAAIRGLPGADSLPIVMVSGLEKPASVLRAYRVGATDFVVKPVAWEGLWPRLELLLAMAGPLAALRAADRQTGAPVGILPDLFLELNPEGVILAVADADAAAFRGVCPRPPTVGDSLLNWLPSGPVAAALAQLRADGRASCLASPFMVGRRWVRLLGNQNRLLGVVRYLDGPAPKL